MSMMSPELARAIHDDRRERLLADAEARRLRRALRASRLPEMSARSLRGRLGALLRGGCRRHDPKVARLTASWLDLDDRTARELARAADELPVPPGTRLVPGRFSYLGLDDAHRGMVITAGMLPVTITSSATVLVLTTDVLEATLPALRHHAVAWTEPDAAPPPPVGRRDRVVRRRPLSARAPDLEGVRAGAGPARA